MEEEIKSNNELFEKLVEIHTDVRIQRFNLKIINGIVIALSMKALGLLEQLWK